MCLKNQPQRGSIFIAHGFNHGLYSKENEILACIFAPKQAKIMTKFYGNANDAKANARVFETKDKIPFTEILKN